MILMDGKADIKLKIKNELWRWNYIIPFTKKYKQNVGKAKLAKIITHSLRSIKPVRGKGIKRSVGTDTKALLSKVKITFSNKNRFVYFIDTGKTIVARGNILSNFTLDYDKIIHGSFATLVQEASGSDEYGKQADAVAEGVDILVAHILRHLQDADMPEDVKANRIRDFSHMLSRPAEHFEEALQRILFFNQILWQTRHRLNGLGRLDFILDDLYTADLANGELTRDDAAGAILDFITQLSQYAEYKSDALMGDIGQIIILGGLQTDGQYFANELTELFLLTQAKLGKPDPKTLLRVSKNMPVDLLRVAIDCLKSKTGSPLFSNDDVVVPALLNFGMPAKDAYSYCTSACWEPYIVGKSLDQNNIAVYDFFKPLDSVLKKNRQYTCFDDLFQDYLEENDRQWIEFLNGLNLFKWAKDPLVSLFTESANKQRKDISEGSAVYNNYGITTVAMGNTVDSLLNIKHKVFDSGEYKLDELETARRNNFRSQEIMQHMVCKEKFFGHDDDEAITLTEKITGRIADIARCQRNNLGGTVKFGLSSPGYNMLSRHTAADYSGRKTGMPYGTHISCMDAAYTEVICFASRLSYGQQRFNGNVVDFFLPGQFLEDNAEKFVLFLEGAIQQGFFQMQMNIMDSKTLIDAKVHPEKYAGLIVRVWGFSAYFNDLPESYQDLLIERALAAERVA